MSPIEFKTGVIRPVECFKEGWELIKDEYWLFLGISLVGGLIAGFSLYILLGAMFCGIYYCLQQKYNHQPFNFGDLFKGFEFFLPGFIASLFFVVPNILMMISNLAVQLILPGYIQRNGGMEAFWSFFGIYMGFIGILGIIMACFHALIIFTFPLIVEYRLSGIEALKLSMKAVWQNLGGVIGLIACQIGLAFIGLLACYFGIFFVLPLMYAGIYVAYRKVFPSGSQPGFDVPP
ncbi:MAG: hypothetical protein ACR2LT_08905, partial [Pyrinomonadaceae bacterium]